MQQRAQQGQRLLGLGAGGDLQGPQPRQLQPRRVAFMHPQLAAQQVDQRLEGAAAVFGRAAAFQGAKATAGQGLAQLAHQAALADAGLAVQQQGLALARHRALPVLQHLGQLGVAADEGGEVGAVIKALGAQHRPLFDGAPHRARVVEALEARRGLDQRKVEALTGNAAGGGPHVHRTGRRGLLQARGVVHRRAHRLAVADDHPPGGHADAQLQAQRRPSPLPG